MSTFVWPNGTLDEPICTDIYAPRTWSMSGVRRFHTGDDAIGFDELRAIADGTVIESSRSDWAGWQVLIYLGEIDGIRTWVRYCHLKAQSHLRRGDRVSAGDLVGLMGMTGVATGVHLHWEIYLGRVDRGGGTGPHDVGTTVDPREFVRAHLTTTPAGQKEDDTMCRPMTMAKVTKGTTVEVTTFWPDGNERVFQSTNTKDGQSYNRNVALAYGCAPECPIVYITASHYDKIKAENAEARSRPGVGRA